MFSSEIKETVYIAISLMVLALVLGMVAVLFDIRSDFAEIRNDEIITATQMAEYRKFNKYDSREITGVDIIELIREVKDKSIEIYVDKLNGGGSYYLTPAMISVDNSIVDVDTLQALIKPDYVYIAYLRYDFDNVKTVAQPDIDGGNYATITGVSIKYLYRK